MATLPLFGLRLAVATIAAVVLAGTTLTLAADRVTAPQPLVVPAPPKRELLTVPEVTGQAYVFAKGILQDRGFAWHVSGSVQGFAANVVASQTPVAGTTVFDTGAPTIDLTLERNSSYVERGTPENAAPYAGTAVQPAPTSSAPAARARLEPVPVPATPVARPRQTVTAPLPVLKPKVAKRVSPVVPPAPTPVGPVTTTPAATTPTPATAAPVTPAPVTTTPTPTTAAAPKAPTPTTAAAPKAPTPTTAAAPKAPTPTTAAAPTAPTPTAATPASAPSPVLAPSPAEAATPASAPSPVLAPSPAEPRAPDFDVTGAPSEPAQSQPLPERAQALAAWLEQHRQPTAKALEYWLYEHAYIVAGAKFGWWHGAEALRTLIAVDRRAEVLWGVGKQSELAARSALAQVSAKR